MGQKIKEIFILFIANIIASSVTVNGQRSIPQTDDNLILIFGVDSTEQNLQSFARFLVDEGFSFASKDSEFFILTTNERTSQGGYKYILTISFKDSIIYIRPKCNYVVFGSSIGNIQTEWTNWSYSKSKHSAAGIALNAFEPILRKYNGELFYKKE
jgi:hypothetical protein